MTGRRRRFTALEARKLAHDAPLVHRARTAMAASAMTARVTRSPRVTVCAKTRPSTRQIAVIRQMFATRETHWKATFSAM